MPKYSATMVSHSFWFAEFQAYIELLNAGYSEDDIRAKAEEDNYFKQKTAARTQDLLKVLKKRLVTLDQDYFVLFPSLDISNQKLVNLISIMNMNRLFNEFMYEVYRGELLLGDARLHDYEIEDFFNRKRVENAQIADWTEETVERLAGIFKTFCREAELLKNRGDYDEVNRPMLDLRLEDLLQAKHAHRNLAVLLGR